MHPTLDFLIEMASQAGQILLQYNRKELDAKHKSRTDLVTGADHASEKHLIHIIQQAFPDHAINAEESGEWTGETAHKWYLDPLDGTLNYAHGIPFYCVSIGYAYRGQMVLGVVYDPIRGNVFVLNAVLAQPLMGLPSMFLMKMICWNACWLPAFPMMPGEQVMTTWLIS